MPTYVYKFVDTGETVEVQQSFADDSLTEYEHPATGEVMPVGGIREKVLSAKRLGVKRVLLPAENERDVQQLEEEWTRGLDIIHVEHFDDVVREAFGR